MTESTNTGAEFPLGSTSIQNREQRAAIIATVKSFADAPAPIHPDHIRRLLALENTLYPIIQADKRWFFSNIGRTEAVQFSRDLHILHSFAAKSLQALIERRGEWTQSEHDPLLVQAIAFALYHLGASVKWCFFRHEPVKPTLWPDLHSLYRFADVQGVSTTALVLFDEESRQPTTILSLYLRALLLEVLNTGSLSMPQIEIADGWLAEWTPSYKLDHSYAARAHALYVDLDAMAGMQLVTGTRPKPGYRYVRVDALKEQIETVKVQLRIGSAFRGRGADHAFPMEEHVALLSTIERLNATLLHSSASRIEERMLVDDLKAEVHLGFAGSRRALMGDTDQAGAATTEKLYWRVHDLSSKGIGLMVDRGNAERAGVGELLAVRPDGFSHFMLGVIVRKLTQRALGETLLGIELLSYRPLPVSLGRYNQPRDTEPDRGSPPIEAMYLPGRDADGKADILALPGGDFGLKNVFELPSATDRFRVRINRVLRKGPDWIGLRFEVIGKH